MVRQTVFVAISPKGDSYALVVFQDDSHGILCNDDPNPLRRWFADDMADSIAEFMRLVDGDPISQKSEPT